MIFAINDKYEISGYDNGRLAIYQDFNPITQNPFKSEDDAVQYLESVYCKLIKTGDFYCFESDGSASNNIDTEDFELKSAIIFKINELDLECEESIQKGFYSEATGEKHFYRFNKEEDQLNFAQQGGLINLAPENFQTIYWKTEDAGVIAHTIDQFKVVILDAVAHKSKYIGLYWQLKAKVLEITDVEKIKAITFSEESLVN